MLTQLLILQSFHHLQWLYKLEHLYHELENITRLQRCMLYLIFVPVIQIDSLHITPRRNSWIQNL